MFAYLVRRVLSTIPTLLGVWIVIFVLFNVVGGDPVYMMLGKHATPQLIADVRAEYGYDKPLLTQFARYLGEAATFNWGDSRATRQPISQMILDGIGPSLTLTVPAFLITTVLSILMGLLVAYFRGRWVDKVVIVGSVIAMSVPMLAFILFGQYFLAFKLGMFPIHGFESGWPERFEFVLLPAVIWVAVSLGYNVRFYRTALVEEVGQDYVRTARAKGLGELPIFLKHVLKNGMVPILTNIVIEIPMLVLGSFLLESFFGIPGLGGITISAINNSDFPVIRAMTTLVAMLFIIGNLATDILYTFVDPRVRLK